MKNVIVVLAAMAALVMGCDKKAAPGSSSEAPAKLGIKTDVQLEECKGEFDGNGAAFKLKSGVKLYFNKSCTTQPGCDVWSESKNEENCPKGSVLSLIVPSAAAGSYQASETLFHGLEKNSSEFIKDFAVTITRSSDSEITGSVKADMPEKKISGNFVAKMCPTPEDLLR